MPALVALDNTLGALLLAAVFSAILYGMNIAQVFHYYTKYSARDSISLKLFVAVLWIFDTACLLLTSWSFYITDVTNFGDFIADLHPPWSFGPGGTIVAIMSVCIQNFYSYKIYQLSRHALIPLAISVTSLGIAGFATTFSIKYMQSHFITDVFHNMRFAKTAAGLHIPCNALITISMVYNLVRNRNDIKRTNTALNLLSFYAINCGALNLVFSVICFAFLLKFPSTLLFVPFFILTIGIYFSSFMANLNSRHLVRRILESSGGVVTIRRGSTPSNDMA